jgi:hypothetical protein
MEAQSVVALMGSAKPGKDGQMISSYQLNMA